MGNVSEVQEIKEDVSPLSVRLLHQLFGSLNRESIWLGELWAAGGKDKIPLFGKVLEMLTGVLSSIVGEEGVWCAMNYILHKQSMLIGLARHDWRYSGSLQKNRTIIVPNYLQLPSFSAGFPNLL